MQDNGNDNSGAGGDTVVSAARDEGWMEVPHANDEHFERKAGPLFDRLGRPKDAKGYTFEDPQDFEFSDSDREYRESFRPVAHRLGLTARQVRGLADWQVQ